MVGVADGSSSGILCLRLKKTKEISSRNVPVRLQIDADPLNYSLFRFPGSLTDKIQSKSNRFCQCLIFTQCIAFLLHIPLPIFACLPLDHPLPARRQLIYAV